ncbi:MAG: TRAP transporter large permease [Deltaproteobacteria bacterium]|nr:TRAP transporter large permease [Deltaproteobacteria bacterium]
MVEVLFITLVICLVLGVPIVISIGIATFSALQFTDIPLVMLAKAIYTATDVFPLHAVPLFILAGALMEMAGMSEQVVDVIESMVGWIRGGLAMAVVIGSMFFGAMSGSGPATAAAIGFIMIPALANRGYDKGYAAALTSSAGTLGILIPPSNPMIVYGVVSQASIVGLFIAGVIPGIFVTATMIVISFVICFRRNYGRKTAAFDFKTFVSVCWRSKWSLMAPLIILGGIYGGIFTPVEASVVAVNYAILVGMFITKKLNIRIIFDCFSRTTLISGSMIILIGLSTSFGELLTLYQVPQQIAEMLGAISTNVKVIYLIIIFFLVILGTFMDTMATIIVLTPILLPVMVKLGVHPIHFGIVFVVTNEIAFLTPPVGANLFAMTGVAKLPIEQIAREEVPFIVGLIIAVIVLAWYPQIAMFLPRLMGYAF